MDSAENKEVNKQGSQPKSKILRISDIIPPFKKDAPPKESKTASLPIMSGQPAPTEPQKPQIPNFSLAENIMAEQRKLSADKRISPAGKVTPTTQISRRDTAGRAIERPIPEDTEIDEIIAQIVTRDIEIIYSSV